MARKKSTKPDLLLSRPVVFRVTAREYDRLEEIQKKSDCHSIGEVLRRILRGREIKLFHRDASLDGVTEELASIREELRAIGVNINQITHRFHTSRQGAERARLAQGALDKYQQVAQQVHLLLSLIAQLARKW